MSTAPLEKTMPAGPIRLSHTATFWLAFGAVMAALIAAPLILPPFWGRFLTESLIWGLLAMSSDLLIGYTGMVSFGHSAFFGLGMYGASEHIFGDNFMAFAPRAGVGFMSHLSDNLAVRAEALAHSLITDDWNWAGSVELGLVYHFGDTGAAKPAPAVRNVAVDPAAPAAPRVGGLVEKKVEGDTVRLTYDLNFAYDSAVIDPKFFAALDEAVDTLQQFPNATASIEGHADRTSGGSGAAYNRNLSQRRADAVLSYVNGKGINNDRLQARGFGFDMPKFQPASNPDNRRVEIIIRGAK